MVVGDDRLWWMVINEDGRCVMTIVRIDEDVWRWVPAGIAYGGGDCDDDGVGAYTENGDDDHDRD